VHDPELQEASPVCLNCGEKLTGAFCSRCGQEAVDLHRPLPQLASDFLDDVLDLDKGLLRTIGPLLFRPGWLTREYLAGRRIRYVKPLRLYLLAALLFFGVLALWPEAGVRLVLKQSGRETRVVKPTTLPAQEGQSWQEKGLRKALADPERFGESFATNLPRAFFLLLPAFALLLKLLYLRRNIHYLDHLIFALHFHAFAFVALTARIPARAGKLPPAVSVPLSAALLIWTLVYLLLALRKVYGDSWAKAGLRFVALLALYGIVFGFALFSLMMITLYLF
jgi:Protein of unknown function (DUF3667)